MFLRVVFTRSSQDLNLGLFECWSDASYQLSHWSSCNREEDKMESEIQYDIHF